MKKPIEQDAIDSFSMHFMEYIDGWNNKKMQEFFAPVAEKISIKFIELCSGYKKEKDNSYYFYYNCDCVFDSRFIADWIVNNKCEKTFYNFVEDYKSDYSELITEIQSDNMKNFFNAAFHDICLELPDIQEYYYIFDYGYELPIFFPANIIAKKVKCNILLSTGNDYVFEIHNVFFEENRLKPVHGNSILNWLAKTQTMPLSMLALYGARTNFEVTLLQEIKNYHGEAQLVFPLLLSVEEIYDFIHNKKNLYIEKGSYCGLYSPKSKACGPIGIEIEKNLAIPFKYFSGIEVETCKDPNIKATYQTSLNRVNPMKETAWKSPLSQKKGKNIKVINPEIFSDLECSQLSRY